MPFWGYVRKSSKHISNDSYFFLEIKIATCMVRNLFGPEITQNMSRQKMSNSNISTRKIPNSHACST